MQYRSTKGSIRINNVLYEYKILLKIQTNVAKLVETIARSFFWRFCEMTILKKYYFRVSNAIPCRNFRRTLQNFFQVFQGTEKCPKVDFLELRFFHYHGFQWLVQNCILKIGYYVQTRFQRKKIRLRRAELVILSPETKIQFFTISLISRMICSL